MQVLANVQRWRQHGRRQCDAARATWDAGTLVQCTLMIALLAICIASDAFLAQQRFLKDWSLLRHLVDSSAHGAVAFCCWGIFLCQTDPPWLSAQASQPSSPPPSSPPFDMSLPCTTTDVIDDAATESPLHHRGFEWLAFLQRCTLAGVTAALLDVDHYIAAGAFTIDGATHLKHRPFGHAVTFIAAVALLVYKCAPADARTWRVCFAVVALLSHHLRDGMRLGLWFWPLGSTPPIPYVLYLALEEVLPFVMAWWQNRSDGTCGALPPRGFESVALDDRTSSEGDQDEHDVQVRVVAT